MIIRTRTQRTRRLYRLLFLLCIALASMQAQAQSNISVFIRTGAHFPVSQKSSAIEPGDGFGFEGGMAYRFLPHLSAFGAWGWNSFDTKDGAIELIETGYTGGLQLDHPIGQSKFCYKVAAGIVYNHIEAEMANHLLADSGHGLGWQGEAGITYRLWKSFSITPNVRYRSLQRDLHFDNISVPVHLDYLSAGITWTVTFAGQSQGKNSACYKF